MKKEKDEDLSGVLIEPIKNKWFYLMKTYLKIFYYKITLR